MILLGGVRIEAEVELVAPAEVEAGAAERVVAQFGGGVALGEIGGVGCQFVGDHPDLDVVAVGQAEMLFRRNVAKHCGAVPADHRSADSAGDMVVAGRDVGRQRPQGVEWRFAAHRELFFHILLDLVHRDVAGAFDHHLHVARPGALG